MPIKKSREEIEKFWISKVTNPDVVKARFEDVRDETVKRMKRAVNIMTPVNEMVGSILDRYGIIGGRRMDYYSFARRVWRVVYERKGDIANRYFDAVYDYFKKTLDLDEDIMREIGESVKEYAEHVRAREEEERKALLTQSLNISSGESGGSPQIGDSSPSQVDGASGKS